MANYPEEDEKYIVSTAMIKYGGSFVRYLGHALSVADQTNRHKIKETFSDYWNEYLQIGKQDNQIMRGF
jgi:hypothetical protein